MSCARVLNSINRYRWWFFILWAIPTFFIWAIVGARVALQYDPDAPGGPYIFAGLVVWFFVHLLPVIVVALLLAVYRWRVRVALRQG
ncbi:hypothetical protein [Tatumella citrea]|uniref:Uncharacterized protein n=1 Tax=Tatumella citrea TaxID=53336 RepID=A0A1Y0L9R8_TATCI|nr:hypothetical protein [Tatumella citrea]ARU94804.1 hypothetical protein A7K98_14165 [Tatumella citrea]ARU98842.1 hypothetical protein A7K99_14150 [Tatumella citrea]